MNQAEELRNRTKNFALQIIRLFQGLPRSPEAQIIGKQMIRAASSVAANYRAACRARSRAEFFSKMSNVVEEADESAFWIEICIDAKFTERNKVESILTEAYEILKIMAKSRKTSQQKQKT